MSSSTKVLFATGSVILGLLIFGAVVTIASSGKGGSSSGGGEIYVVGNAKSLAGTVSRNGPILLQDLLGNSRDILVQHIGGDDWRTFEAHAPGAARTCVLKWDGGRRNFTDPCVPGRIYPADGAGLTNFPTSINTDGDLVVDLRHPSGPPESTVPPVSSAPPVPTTLAAQP